MGFLSQQLNFCPNCGAPVNHEMTVCPKCGAQLKAVEVPDKPARALNLNALVSNPMKEGLARLNANENATRKPWWHSLKRGFKK